MANSKGRKSNSDKAYYGAYNYDAQRRKRLTRHLKKQPNDEQAQEAVKAKSFKHRGPRPPNKPDGWVTRDMIPADFNSKKGASNFTHSPKDLAFIRRVMRKGEASTRVR